MEFCSGRISLSFDKWRFFFLFLNIKGKKRLLSKQKSKNKANAQLVGIKHSNMLLFKVRRIPFSNSSEQRSIKFIFFIHCTMEQSFTEDVWNRGGRLEWRWSWLWFVEHNQSQPLVILYLYNSIVHTYKFMIRYIVLPIIITHFLFTSFVFCFFH